MKEFTKEERLQKRIEILNKIITEMESENLQLTKEQLLQIGKGEKTVYDFFPELKEKVLPMSWGEIGLIDGWVIDDNDSEVYIVKGTHTTPDARSTFATENQVRSALAIAQLSQLMKVWCGDWKADWMSYESKYAIVFFKDGIEQVDCVNAAHFLAFPTADLCDRFLEAHRGLIEEYFLMYK